MKKLRSEAEAARMRRCREKNFFLMNQTIMTKIGFGFYSFLVFAPLRTAVSKTRFGNGTYK
jgi:hypothetical protein